VFVACVDDDEDAGSAEMSRGGSLANLMVETSTPPNTKRSKCGDFLYFCNLLD
jgi:hypothetical protein